MILKMAQRQAALPDDEYRAALELVSGCQSSTDAAFTNRHLDTALAYFEAIYWHKVDAGELQAPCNRDAVFQRRGYWANKNTRQETSRDRYLGQNIQQEIAGLEAQLQALGFGQAYCQAIRENVTHGRTGERSAYLYRAALERTLQAKRNAAAAA